MPLADGATKGEPMFKQMVFLAAVLATPTLSAAEEWGSIAYSPKTGAVGFSHNYDSRGLAGDWAMSYCDANDCRIVVNFYNACGALAVGSRGGWGAAWGTTRSRAETNALNSCQKYDGGCRVKRWVCSE